MGAVTMASSSLVLRPRASSSLPSTSPRRAPTRRAALPAPRRLRAAAAETPPREGGLSVVVAGETRSATTTRLYSLAPYPLLLAALLPGAEPISAAFEPFVELVRTLSLPDWLVHWGHPGNMAVVLFAMGGYGTYLGFRIKLSDDPEEKAKAKDLHPKLLGGMFFFFALGATGGVTALLTSGKPIFERYVRARTSQNSQQQCTLKAWLHLLEWLQFAVLTRSPGSSALRSSPCSLSCQHCLRGTLG
uniref:Uncharacterized protein n=1 Tax=Aegilops tauschii subsp. strangulata TaxID=200361 RepID=A0A453J3G7_AEGTS